ncbi:hypothetical protein V8E51_019354 [Hyaloscypha variabilis]
MRVLSNFRPVRRCIDISSNAHRWDPRPCRVRTSELWSPRAETICAQSRLRSPYFELSLRYRHPPNQARPPHLPLPSPTFSPTLRDSKRHLNPLLHLQHNRPSKAVSLEPFFIFAISIPNQQDIASIKKYCPCAPTATSHLPRNSFITSLTHSVEASGPSPSPPLFPTRTHSKREQVADPQRPQPRLEDTTSCVSPTATWQ